MLGRLLPDRVARELCRDLADGLAARAGGGGAPPGGPRWRDVLWCWRQVLSPQTFRLALMLRGSRRSRPGDASAWPVRGGRPVGRGGRGDGGRLRGVARGLLHDLRFGLRSILRRPGLSALVVGTLAVGIGANTAIFSVVNGLLLRPLPGIEDADELVEVLQGRPGQYISVSYPIFRHLRRDNDVLRDMAAWDIASFAVGGGADPEVALGLQVTGNYLDLLGARPALGRFFAPEESFHPDAEPAAVISHHLWQRRFDGDPGIVGRTVLLNGEPVPVVGVAAEGFGGHMVAVKADVFVPLGIPVPQVHGASTLDHPRNGVLEILGRLRPGVDREAAGAALAGLARARIRALEGPEAEYPVHVEPYGAVPGSVRGGFSAFALVLMAVVGLVLLVACANVATLLLSRALERRREVAVRLAMGAARGRIVRQHLVEAILMAVAGGLLGGLGALWATRLLAAFQPPLPLSGARLALEVHPDARVLGFTLGVAVATGLVFGIAPALRCARHDLVSPLKGEFLTGGVRPLRAQRALVAAQTALTVLLLVGAGLLARALDSARSIDLGFDTADVVAVGFDLELNGYEPERSAVFYRELLHRTAVLPGVEAAALAGKLPLAGASAIGMRVPGREAPAGSHGWSIHNQSVSPGYFETLGIPLLRGRGIGRLDVAGAPGAVVVNETAARRLWPDEDPLGRSILLRMGDEERQFSVVGVAADARYHGLREETPIFGYFSYRQRPRTDMQLHLRAASSADAVAEVRRIVADLDAGVPILGVQSLSEVVDLRMLPQRIGAWIVGVAGLFGLALGALGIYGITATAVRRRTHEIGIRMALGARSGDILALVARQGMLPPLVGAAVGVATALLATRLLRAFLVGVSPLDPLAFAAALAGFLAVAFLANLLPVRRAAALDPANTLRAE